MNQLEQLRQYTTVVADTGDIEAMKLYQPQDATTNPTLVLKTVQDERYAHLIDAAILWAKEHAHDSAQQLYMATNKLMVDVGVRILELIPGRVSTEVDARLSFDSHATCEHAKSLIELYESEGISKERVLIKIASTWEGIQAAAQLEKEGIHCNLTLMFNFMQAIACAEAGVTLISPFVGRIYDWYKQDSGHDFRPDEDPGVLSVQHIYHYYRHFDIKTVIMGASFRHVGQVLALTGCDYLTISPNLLQALKDSEDSIEPRLSVDEAKSMPLDKVELTEAQFRWSMCQDAMATEKLAHGIRSFDKDLVALRQILAKQI